MLMWKIIEVKISVKKRNFFFQMKFMVKDFFPLLFYYISSTITLTLTKRDMSIKFTRYTDDQPERRILHLSYI